MSKSKFEQDRDEAAIHDVCRRVNGSTEWAKIWSYGADWAREYTLKEADALIGELESGINWAIGAIETPNRKPVYLMSILQKLKAYREGRG